MIREINYIEVRYSKNDIDIIYAIQGQVIKVHVTKDNKEIFTYMQKYIDKIPYTDIENEFRDIREIKGTHISNLIAIANNNKLWKAIYIRPCKQLNKAYVIKCNLNALYLLILDSLKDEELNRSVRYLCLADQCFYNLTLGKKLGTIAYYLDMPPEIACLLEEV